jgi:hypothetical protein
LAIKGFVTAWPSALVSAIAAVRRNMALGQLSVGFREDSPLRGRNGRTDGFGADFQTAADGPGRPAFRFGGHGRIQSSVDDAESSFIATCFSAMGNPSRS